MSAQVVHGSKPTNPSKVGKPTYTNENQEGDSHYEANEHQDFEEQDVSEYIRMLEEHQSICEREGRYVEAEVAKNRIVELKTQMENGRREELLQRHQIEKQQLEEEHLSEFKEFNEFWDQKMEEFNEQARTIEEQMILRHQEEAGKFIEDLETSITTKPRDSAEILNLRKMQQILAKQKDYIEAHKIQQQCMKLERVEIEKWQSVREQKIKNQKVQLEKKQANELSAIRKRIVTGQEEQRKARSLDLERLLHKYQNTRKELMLRQQAELNQLSKSYKSGASTFGSVFRSQSSKMNMTNNSSMQKWTSKPSSDKRNPLGEAGNLNRTTQKTAGDKRKGF